MGGWMSRSGTLRLGQGGDRTGDPLTARQQLLPPVLIAPCLFCLSPHQAGGEGRAGGGPAERAGRAEGVPGAAEEEE